MRSSVLTITLGKHLLERINQGETKTDLAERIGVSTAKLTRMTKDEWKYITRDAIEKAADSLNLKVEEVFQFVPVEFWKPIEDEKRCIFVRGSKESETGKGEFIVPWYDDAATTVIKKFLRESLKGIAAPPTADNFETEDQLKQKVMSENCVVIGSPKTNRSTDVLLRRLFNPEPSDGPPRKRRRLPFAFCWPAHEEEMQQSILTCSESERKRWDGVPGIVVDGFHVAAEFRPREKYLDWETNEGRDCGFVFVMNRPFNTSNKVKLIIVAGLAGIGTQAAATAVVKDFRYLEPIEKEPYVYGVVEGIFSKRAGDEHRTLTEVRWKYRKGGHAPIEFMKSKQARTETLDLNEKVA